MGYNTQFNLSFDTDDEEVANYEMSYGLPLCKVNPRYFESCKWYEWEEEMTEISEKFPRVLFTLTGEGEDAGDLWIAYFRNGESQICQARITYDPMDPDLGLPLPEEIDPALDVVSALTSALEKVKKIQ